jgi:hypothetical protein
LIFFINLQKWSGLQAPHHYTTIYLLGVRIMPFLKNQRSLLLVLLLTLLQSPDASSQQAASSYAGGQQPTAAQVMVVPTTTTAAYASDYSSNLSFNACLQQCNLQLPLSGDDDPLALAAGAAGGLLGTVAGGGVTGGATGSVGNLSLGMADGMFGGGSCQNVPLIDRTSCEDYQFGDPPRFNKFGMESALTSAKKAESAAQCKVRTSKYASCETGCFETEFQNLRLAMKKAQDDLNTKMKDYKKYESDVNAEIDRQKQREMALDAKAQDYNDAMAAISPIIGQLTAATGGDKDRGSIAGLEQRLKDQVAIVNAFRASIPRIKESRAAKCFLGEGAVTSELQSCPGSTGEVMTPLNCVLTLYQNSRQQIIMNGAPTDPAGMKTANFDLTQLKSRLVKMVGELNAPNPAFKTVAEWENFHRKELTGYGTAGVQLLNEMTRCADQANTQVDNEVRDPSIPSPDGDRDSLGSRNLGIQTTANTINSEMGAILEQMNGPARTQIAKLMGGEPGGAFDPNSCHQTAVVSNSGEVGFNPQPLQKQLNCIKQQTAVMMMLRDGTTPPGFAAGVTVGPFPMGVTDDAGQPMTCKSLRDCIQTAQTARRAADAKVSALSGSGSYSGGLVNGQQCPSDGCPGLKKFHHDANSAIQNFLTTAGQQFAGRVFVAKMEWARVKASLGRADIDFPRGVDAPKVDLNKICPVGNGGGDDTGQICQVPGDGQDFDEILCGLSGMPYFGKEADPFGEIRRQARDQANEATAKMSDAARVVATLGNNLALCDKKDKMGQLTRSLAIANGDLEDQLGSCRDNAEMSGERPDGQVSADLEDLKEHIRHICDEGIDPSSHECETLRRRSNRALSQCQRVADAARKRLFREFMQDKMMEANFGAKVNGAAPEKTAQQAPGGTPAVAPPPPVEPAPAQ